jgi:hypothetical protein
VRATGRSALSFTDFPSLVREHGAVASHGDEGGDGGGEEALLMAGVKDDPHLWSDVLAAAAALRVRTAGDAHGSTHSMPAVVNDAVGVATADALAAAAQRLAWLAAVAPDERVRPSRLCAFLCSQCSLFACVSAPAKC